MDTDALEYDFPVISQLKTEQPVFYKNPFYTSVESSDDFELTMKDIQDAEARLRRFAPFLEQAFPETAPSKGIIESPIVRIPTMTYSLSSHYNVEINNNVYVKLDNLLPISGSIKARGGIYSVLKLAEQIAKDAMILENDSDYTQFLEDHFRDEFSKYKLICASTGNLGLSVGIMGTTLGFNTEIHMSKDAKDWKKQLLRDHGATVVEHDADYSKAVKQARIETLRLKRAFFIDDENSKTLFLGYAVAALRLKEQFDAGRISVDKDHPLYVYLPCGVGGAPGGVSFGLKLLYGDNVHPVFVEPTKSPAFMLGALTQLHNDISVEDIELDGRTEADGLAVSRPSKFVGKYMNPHIHSFYTVQDQELFNLLKLVRDTEGFKVEPSAAAGLIGPTMLGRNLEVSPTATHLVWLTGGSMMPTQEFTDYYNRGER